MLRDLSGCLACLNCQYSNVTPPPSPRHVFPLAPFAAFFWLAFFRTILVFPFNLPLAYKLFTLRFYRQVRSSVSSLFQVSFFPSYLLLITLLSLLLQKFDPSHPLFPFRTFLTPSLLCSSLDVGKDGLLLPSPSYLVRSSFSQLLINLLDEGCVRFPLTSRASPRMHCLFLYFAPKRISPVAVEPVNSILYSPPFPTSFHIFNTTGHGNTSIAFVVGV